MLVWGPLNEIGRSSRGGTTGFDGCDYGSGSDGSGGSDSNQ